MRHPSIFRSVVPGLTEGLEATRSAGRIDDLLDLLRRTTDPDILPEELSALDLQLQRLATEGVDTKLVADPLRGTLGPSHSPLVVQNPRTMRQMFQKSVPSDELRAALLATDEEIPANLDDLLPEQLAAIADDIGYHGNVQKRVPLPMRLFGQDPYYDGGRDMGRISDVLMEPGGLNVGLERGADFGDVMPLLSEVMAKLFGPNRHQTIGGKFGYDPQGGELIPWSISKGGRFGSIGSV